MPYEKLEAHFQEFMSAPGVQFASPEAEQAFKQRVQMIKDVVEVKKPARVPVCPTIGFYPFTYAGVTAQEAMYDYGKLAAALMKFHSDFLPDSLSSAPIYGSGKIFEIL